MDIFSYHIELDIDRVSEFWFSEIGPVLSERDEWCREISSTCLDDREARAIQAHTPFLDNEMGIHGIELDSEYERSVIFFLEFRHGSDGIDMSWHDVSIEPLSECDASFHIKCISHFFCSEIGHTETLLHDEKFVVFCRYIRECHACPIMSDTLPDF